MTANARLREMVSVAGPKVVTAGHAAAAAAGAGAYASGGNAFDAALAACFMEHIVLPMKCGLFGDLVALHRRSGGPFEALVSVGPGPAALAKGEALERVGPRSVGIPGAPHGYATLLEAARLDARRLVEPAIRASRTGVPWTRLALSYLSEAREALARLSPQNPYAPGGALPQVGDVRVLPGLGDWLLSFAHHREALFDDELGERIVAELRRRGGILTHGDLRTRPATRIAPLSGEVSSHVALTVTPAPTHGPRLIEVVREALRSAEPLPAIVRADREVSRREGRAPTDEGTSVVMAADDEGNAVIILHSNSFPQFASGIVLDDGLILNNRPGRGFDLTAPQDAANAPKAGRVPRTTLHGWVLDDRGCLTLGATPGGVNQLPWNAQTVVDIVRGAQLPKAVTNPRWALDAEDVLTAEPGAETSDLTAARELGPLSLRSAQQCIRLESGNGLHTAAADPRAGAAALALY